MGIFLAVGLVTVILLGTKGLIRLLARVEGPVLAVLQSRRHARLARTELAEIDREYEDLVAKHF